MYSQTSRTPNGLTNAAEWQTLGACGAPDPTWVHQHHDDFDRYAAADWTITLVGTGTVTQTAYDGGAIILTTTTGAADAVQLQRPVATRKLNPGKDTFFKFAGVLSDVVNSVFYAGLIATSTTPLTANDGVFIEKASGSGALQLISKVGGVATSANFPSSLVLANNVAFEIGIHVTATGDVEAFFNPTTGNNPIAAQNGAPRGAVAKLTAPTLTTALLNQSFGIVNSAAAAHTLTADFVTTLTHR